MHLRRSTAANVSLRHPRIKPSLASNAKNSLVASASLLRLTRVLAAALDAESGTAQRLLIDSFQNWKCGDEYGHYLFGKDSAYAEPSVDGNPYLLRHVHLAPLSDQYQLNRWNSAWQRRSRKTSDRVLVYVERIAANRTSYLLIYILPEPEAHAIAAMKTQEHRELMEGFANVAAAFLDSGEVIA